MGRGSGLDKVAMVVAVLLFPWCALGQNGAPAGESASALSRMLECESTDGACAQPNARYSDMWTFDGTSGKVTSPAGNDGTELMIESMDRDKIVIQRVDRSGDKAGRSGTYTGSIHGTRISGTVQWLWPGHPDFPSAGTWSAILQDEPAAPDSSAAAGTGSQGLPMYLVECENNGLCNGAWIIQGSEGTATWFDQNSVRAKLTVIRSAPDDLLIRRTDLTDGNSAVYAGARHGDSYSGAVVWSSPSHPGDSSGHWTASVPQTTCDANAGLSSADAVRIGQNALMFNLKREAFGCYIVAAKAGDDPLAQTAVGLLYYQGRNAEVPQDYKQALFWLRKAADQGVYAAQKTVADMYTLGQGTPRNLQLAHFYADKAAEQKRDMERQQDREERALARQQDRAERALDRRANMLSGFIMGAAFGALLF